MITSRKVYAFKELTSLQFPSSNIKTIRQLGNNFLGSFEKSTHSKHNQTKTNPEQRDPSG